MDQMFQIAEDLNLPALVKLPRHYPPSRVMSDPQRMREAVADYFSMLTEDPDNPKPPTPPGLAMALGLRGFDALLQIKRTEEADPGTYSEEAMAVLDLAAAYIEDYYLTYGLKERLPAAFTKFLLSAYFNRSEKTIQEMVNQPDNNIQVNVLGVSQPLPPSTRKNAQNGPESIRRVGDAMTLPGTKSCSTDDPGEDELEFNVFDPTDEELDNL